VCWSRRPLVQCFAAVTTATRLMASAFGGYNFADAQDKRRQQREYGLILLRQAQEREQQKALEKQSGTVNTKLSQAPVFAQNQNPNNPFQLQPPLAQPGDARDASTPSRRGRRLRPISGMTPPPLRARCSASNVTISQRLSQTHPPPLLPTWRTARPWSAWPPW
jgi:hypothetical protein